MKSLRTLVAGLLLAGIASGLSAADRAAGWAVVEKGIKAAGGAEKLGQFQSARMTEKGKYYGMNESGFEFTAKAAYSYPDKSRFEVVDVFTVILNGDKAWTVVNGQATEMPAEKVEWQKEDAHATVVSSLVPLKDEKYGLEVVGDVTAEGRPCTAVKVTRKDRKDVFLDFDKDSGLLTRVRRKAWSDELSREVDQEMAMFDYADQKGAKMPGRVIIKRDGKLFVEVEISDYEPGELSESLFNP